MRRCCVALSIAVACLMWALGAPATHAGASSAERSIAPAISALPTIAADSVAILPPSPLRNASPTTTSAVVFAVAAFVFAAWTGLATRRRGWSDISPRPSVRTRGPPLSPARLFSAP
jgi:hypothetical protein